MRKSILYISPEVPAKNISGGALEVYADLLMLKRDANITCVIVSRDDFICLPQEILGVKCEFVQRKARNIIVLAKRLFISSRNVDEIWISCYRSFISGLILVLLGRRKKIIFKSHGSLGLWSLANLRYSKGLLSTASLGLLALKVIYYFLHEFLICVGVLGNRIVFMRKNCSGEGLIFLSQRLLSKANWRFGFCSSAPYFAARSVGFSKGRCKSKLLIVGDWRLNINSFGLSRFLSDDSLCESFSMISIVGKIDRSVIDERHLSRGNVSVLGYIHNLDQLITEFGSCAVLAVAGSGVPIKLIESVYSFQTVYLTKYALEVFNNLDLKNIRCTSMIALNF